MKGKEKGARRRERDLCGYWFLDAGRLGKLGG